MLLGLMMKELCSKCSHKGPHHPMSSHDVKRDPLQWAWKHLSCFGMSSCFKYSLCLHFDCSYALTCTVCLPASFEVSTVFRHFVVYVLYFKSSGRTPESNCRGLQPLMKPYETLPTSRFYGIWFILIYTTVVLLYHFTCLCRAWIFV